MKQQKYDPNKKGISEEEMNDRLEEKVSFLRAAMHIVDPNKGVGESDLDWMNNNCNIKGDYPGLGFADRNCRILNPQLSKRTITTGTAPGFGGQEHRLDLYLPSPRLFILENIGAKIDQGVKNVYSVPQVISGSAEFVAEGSAGGVEPSYADRIVTSAHTVISSSVFTKKMFETFTPLKNEIILADVQNPIYAAIDHAALFGTSPEPTGALNIAEVPKISGASFSKEIADTMIATVKSADAPSGEGIFLLHPNTEKLLKSRIAGGSNKFLIQEQKLNDEPYLASSRFDEGYITYVIPSTILVTFFGERFILVNSFYDNYGSVRINVFDEVDVNFRNTDWCIIATSVD